MSGLGDLLGNVGNVLGYAGGQGLNLLNLAATIEHGGLQNYLANKAALAQDPGARALIEQSPFFSGAAGYGMPGQVPNPADIRSGYSNTGDIIRGIQGNPSLPPLLPPAGTMSPDQAQQYAQNIHVGQPGGPTMATVKTPFGAERFGGGPQTVEFPTFDAAQSAAGKSGLVPIQTPRGGYSLRAPVRPPAAQGVASPEDLQALGLSPSPAPQQAPAPAAAPAEAQAPAEPAAPPAKEAPAEPFQLPPGFTPFEGAPAVAAQAETGKVGFPSPAFVDNKQSIAQFEKNLPPTGGPLPPAGMPARSQATPPAVQPMAAPPPLPPGFRVSAKIAPGVTLSRSGPAPAKPDFSELASKRVLPLIERADQAIDRLTKKGVLSDDYTGIALNRVRLEYEARKPKADPDAVFLVRNLRSAVPLLARGFGEQRTNRQEEQRLSDALSFNFMSASAARAILDNYKELFSTGTSAALERDFPTSAQNIQGGFATTLSPAQQQILQQSQPLGR